jgi:hypothetical protein
MYIYTVSVTAMECLGSHDSRFILGVALTAFEAQIGQCDMQRPLAFTYPKSPIWLAEK